EVATAQGAGQATDVGQATTEQAAPTMSITAAPQEAAPQEAAPHEAAPQEAEAAATGEPETAPRPARAPQAQPAALEDSPYDAGLATAQAGSPPAAEATEQRPDAEIDVDAVLARRRALGA